MSHFRMTEIQAWQRQVQRTCLIRIKEETTYEDIETNSRKTENRSNNFWNFLFLTGYLTKVKDFQKDVKNEAGD